MNLKIRRISSMEEATNMQLVREVEKHPLLYNYRLPDYTKRELIEAAWTEIAEAMNDEVTNCKEKWRNLRTVFVRKLKPLPSGVVKRKSYYLGDAMSFLTPFIKLQKSDNPTEGVASPVRSEADNGKVQDEAEQTEVDEADNSVQPEVPTISRIHTNGSSNHQTHPRRTGSKRHTGPLSDYAPKRSRRYEFDDSRKYFLLSLLPEVERLSFDQMKFFRRKVLDALDDAEACVSDSRQEAMYYNEQIVPDDANGDDYFEIITPKSESQM